MCARFVRINRWPKSCPRWKTSGKRSRIRCGGSRYASTSSRRSSEASVGGNCPFLQEPCLNIQKKGQSSLNGYFDRLIAKDSATLDEARDQMAQVESQRDHAREVRKYFDRLDMYLQQLDSAAEQRMAAEKRLQALAAEQLEIEQPERASPSPDDLAEAQKLFKASDDADRQLRELEPRQAELAQLTSQLADFTRDADGYQSELAGLEPARAALAKALEDLSCTGRSPRRVQQSAASGRHTGRARAAVARPGPARFRI